MNAIANVRRSRRECLTFSLGAEEYAVDILNVQEIRCGDVVTRLPDTPPHVAGVINLRGTIVPVVDLRIKLGLASAGRGADTATIVLDVAGRKVAIFVDGVSDVVDLAPDDIRAVPELTAASPGSPLLGLGTVDDRMVILLDAGAAFQDESAVQTAAAA